MRRIGSGIVAENKGDLSLGWRLGQHPLDILREAHAEHLVRLIEHESAETLEFERTATHVVHHSSRRPDHHMHSAVERSELQHVVLAAVDRGDSQVQACEPHNARRTRRPEWPTRESALSTSTWGWRSAKSMRCSMGRANAAVLPVPV
jgi:hypothetical protein